MKYFLYARKSTDDNGHQLLSIDAQLAELRKFAEQQRLRVVAELVESQTARKPGRPVFNSMMDDIEAGKAQGIVAWHPDRLCRNSIDGGRIIYALDTEKLQALDFPTFWFENTPQGRFMLNIGFGQAKYVVDSLSVNVRRGLREKLRRGEFPGWAPVGYLNDHRLHSIIPDEQKAPLIRRAFETYATGHYTAAELRRTITSWGLTGHSGKPIALSKIPVMLTNPFYIGLFRYKGEIHEGVHEPIVSKQVFDRVQEVMRERKRGKYMKTATRPFRGLLTCAECGAAITSETQKGHHYYRCTGKKGPCRNTRYMREEILAEQIRSAVLRIAISDEWHVAMHEQIDLWREEALDESRATLDRLRKELAEADEKLERMLDLLVEGTITRDEYTLRKEKHVTAKANLKDKIAQCEAKGAAWLEPLETFVNHCKQAKRVAFSENLEELKEFLQLLGSNLVLTGPIDEDDPALRGAGARSAGQFLAHESESLEKRQGGDCSRQHADDRRIGNSILTKSPVIPDIPVHVPILGTSKFSLSSERKRVDRHTVDAPKINRRRLPVVCVKFPKSFQFLAHQPKSGDFSNWRASLMYARTEHDPDYTPDTHQFKLEITYIIPRFT
jgi:site-specific DNA recombinase